MARKAITCREGFQQTSCGCTRGWAARSEVIALVCASCREPDKIIPPGVPRMLLSESDFHDPDRRDGGAWLQLSRRCSFSQFISLPLHFCWQTMFAFLLIKCCSAAQVDRSSPGACQRSMKSSTAARAGSGMTMLGTGRSPRPHSSAS